MIAVESFPAHEERFIVYNFDCMSMEKDPLWQNIEVRTDSLESEEMLA